MIDRSVIRFPERRRAAAEAVLSDKAGLCWFRSHRHEQHPSDKQIDDGIDGAHFHRAGLTGTDELVDPGSQILRIERRKRFRAFS